MVWFEVFEDKIADKVQTDSLRIWGEVISIKENKDDGLSLYSPKRRP
jgi:hypothetical protein